MKSLAWITDVKHEKKNRGFENGVLGNKRRTCGADGRGDGVEILKNDESMSKGMLVKNLWFGEVKMTRDDGYERSWRIWRTKLLKVTLQIKYERKHCGFKRDILWVKSTGRKANGRRDGIEILKNLEESCHGVEDCVQNIEISANTTYVGKPRSWCGY